MKFQDKRKNPKPTRQELLMCLEKIQPLISECVSQAGYRLLKADFVNENQVNYLRVTIFHCEHDISLDDCEFISREVGQRLDNLDIVPFSYSLEVQSPGQSHEFVLSGTNLVLGL